jgi:phosphoribosylformylglycinamidine synthase
VVTEVPAASLADAAPLLDRPSARPDWLEDIWSGQTAIHAVDPMALLLKLLDDPAIGSSAWAHEQYDHMLFLNTVIGPGGDGSLLRIKGTDKALAVSTDGNGRLCYLDPRRGAARLVYESALNVAVTGARPLAVVDNLNFGNPEKPEVMWQLIETVEGISEACETLGIPVIGGNVSFYNETDGIDIYPTPVVGLLGLADPMPPDPPRLSRASEGMEIWVFGPEPTDNFAGSAVQRVVGGVLRGRPTAPDPAMARRVIDLAADLAHLVPVLHDISDGGLAVAVAEICIASGVGARISDPGQTAMFSEDPHRFVVVMESSTVELPDGLARRVGSIVGGSLSFGSAGLDLSVITRAWREALPSALGVG